MSEFYQGELELMMMVYGDYEQYTMITEELIND
jgi:hypothetical protein